MVFDFRNELIFEDSHVRIEPLDPKHFDYLLTISVSKPDLIKFSPSAFGSEMAFKSYIDTALSSRKNNQRYPFALYDKIQNAYIGSSSYGGVSNYDKRVEIGWTWIDPRVQGSGINTHIKYLMLSYVFDDLDFERVEFKIDSRNAQSRRAVEKIGATHEGDLRNHTLMIDGFRRITSIYSIIKPEWPDIKSTLKSKMRS